MADNDLRVPLAGGDWRVTATLRDAAHAGRVLRYIAGHEVEEDVHRRLGRHVAVTADGPRIFLYAGTANAGREAERILREIVAQRNLSAGFALDRWHPLDQEWQDASVAVTVTAAQRQAAHQRLEDEETRESLATGHAQWEVRIELPSHHEAVELAATLRAEGRGVIRRWKFLVVGANTEDQARDLADVIEKEAPVAASVHVEPGVAVIPFILWV